MGRPTAGAPSRFLLTAAGCRLAASPGAGAARRGSLVAVVGGFCRCRSAVAECREVSARRRVVP